MVIHGFAGTSPIVDGVVIFFSEYAIYVFIAIGAWCLWRKRVSLHAAWAAPVFAWAMNQIIGFFFFRPRPFVALHTSPLLDVLSSGKSFPSDHTAVAFAFAVILARTFPRRQWMAYATAGAIGFARVVAGVHYPGDILGGIVVGILAGYCINALDKKI